MSDVTLLLGPLYHLIGDDEKLKALNEAKRVTKSGGLIFVAYLMNEYSILSYCFDEERIGDFLARGVVDQNFHIQTQEGELYDYVRIEDIDRLKAYQNVPTLLVRAAMWWMWCACLDV